MLVRTLFLFLSLLAISYARVCGVCLEECGCTNASLKCTQTDYRKELDLKEGLENGRSSDLPYYSMDFLGYEYSDCPCTWIPMDANCTRSTTEGNRIIIGAGIDLLKIQSANLKAYGVSQSIINKLSPLLAKRTSDILADCKKNWTMCHIELTPAEREELNTKYHDYRMNETKVDYDNGKGANSSAYKDIPMGVRTAIYSYQHFLGTSKYIEQSEIWKMWLANNWTQIIEFFAKCNTTRENDESWILQKALAPKCVTEYGEFIYVLDASGSIGASQFSLAKTFLSNLTLTLNVSQDALRVGVVVFSTKSKEHLALTDNMLGANLSISAIKYIGGSTSTGDALRVAASMIKTEARSSVPYIVAVITDGYQNTGEPLPAPIQALVDLGVNRFAIGVGNKIRQSELLKIAGDSNKVYLVSNYSSLMAIKNSLATKVCYSPQQIKSDETKEVKADGGQARFFETIFKKGEGLTVTINLLDKDVESLEIYYSTKVSNPGKNLYEGKAVITDRHTMKIITNGAHAKVHDGSVDKVSLYYTIVAKESLKAKLVTKPKAEVLEQVIE